MNSAEIYDLGYAIPCYDINTNQRVWRYRSEPTLRIPSYAVPLVDLPGLGFKVARWDDVKRAHQERQETA